MLHPELTFMVGRAIRVKNWFFQTGSHLSYVFFFFFCLVYKMAGSGLACLLIPVGCTYIEVVMWEYAASCITEVSALSQGINLKQERLLAF